MPLEPSILAVLESAINSIDGLSVPDVHSQHVEDFWLDLQRIREAPREDYVDLLIRTALRRWERNNEVLETVIASGPGTVLEQLLSLFEGRCSTADRGSSRLLEEATGRGNFHRQTRLIDTSDYPLPRHPRRVLFAKTVLRVR